MNLGSRPYGPLFRLFHLLLLIPLLFAGPALAQAKPEKLILALGDSLTAGYQLKPGESFPAQLEAALRAQGVAAKVHNAGVSGDTTAQGRARLPWVLNSLKQKPDLAIVALGANDMLRGQPPAQARANLDAILTELNKRGIPVVLAGMLAAPNMGPVYGKEFNALYPALAKKHGATLYPFFTQGVTANPKLLLADGMHPNKQGVALMVKNITPTVQKALPK
ncbi:arylesterase [Sandaracinobacteroides sayramensis]|uniref:arylesterase n=1 Tax=Sandaracinobacteroides sayramensis TaxID=2913411 RepID=UPI003AB9B7BE